MKARDLLNDQLMTVCKMYYYGVDTPEEVVSKNLPEDEKADQLAEYIYMSNRFNPV